MVWRIYIVDVLAPDLRSNPQRPLGEKPIMQNQGSLLQIFITRGVAPLSGGDSEVGLQIIL